MPSRDQREQERRQRPAPPAALTRLNIWFPAAEMAALHALAAKTGRSEMSLVREAVRRLVGLDDGQAQKRRTPQPRTGESQ